MKLRESSKLILLDCLKNKGNVFFLSIVGVKVGESAQGLRKIDGASKRAEQQARHLQRETGELYRTEVRMTFNNKKDSCTYETKLIKRSRRINGPDALPGNKNDH